MSAHCEKLARNRKDRDRLEIERGELVVAARRDGVTWREISVALDMTELSVRRIAERANGGELPRPAR
jgi:hypothetical protein